MKNLSISRNNFLLVIIIWWIIFSVLSIFKFNYFQLLNIIGFSFLSIVPGSLTLLSLKVNDIFPWSKFPLVIGLSLLELMLIGLTSNTLFPLIGVMRPLDSNYLLLVIGFCIIFLVIITWFRLAKQVSVIHIKTHNFFRHRLNLLLTFIPFLFIAQSILGATSLNNGGTNLWTYLMLGEIGAFIIILTLLHKKINENIIPAVLFLIGLSLLFMTSLRGWYITGHDIQFEYKVFEITKNNGVWKMENYRDPYNACLSITILPTVFSNLLKIEDQYIYKFLFQIFFALCPGITYLISREWMNRRTSLLSGLYFMAFPTYFYDMPFFVRQEIALLFFGLMLFIIFKKHLNNKVKELLFILFGIGVILSHYSTTYTFLFILGLTSILTPVFIKFFTKYKKTRCLKTSSLNFKNKTELPDKSQNITFYMVLLLFILCFFWTAIITNTGNGIARIMKETVSAIKTGFFENNRSVDALYFLTFKKSDSKVRLKDYLDKVSEPLRQESPNDYYDEETYSRFNYLPLSDEKVPFTSIGKLMKMLGLNIDFIISSLGQVLAKLLVILTPVGILYLLFRKSYIGYISKEFYMLALCFLLFIFLNLILPVLSTEYGVYRAMQQSLFVLAPIIVIGSITIGIIIQKFLRLLFRHKGNSFVINTFPIGLVIFFLLYITGFIPQAFGGSGAVLHLNNFGPYYNNYYFHKRELYGINWLSSYLANNYQGMYNTSYQIQADRYTKIKINSLTNFNVIDGIFPAIIRKDSYIFLGTGNVKKSQAGMAYNGEPLFYNFPLQFLDQNKNLIFNNGGSKIYK